jgi:hypothetical protein
MGLYNIDLKRQDCPQMVWLKDNEGSSRDIKKVQNYSPVRAIFQLKIS